MIDEADDIISSRRSMTPRTKSPSAPSSRVLGLAPLLALLLVAPVALPRGATPNAVPLPVPDVFALERRERFDHALAAQIKGAPLPDDTRALGSAIRDFHTLEVHDAPARDVAPARHAIDGAVARAIAANGMDPIVGLRAAQLEGFVGEVAAFEATGAESEELGALGGAFVRSMRHEGWIVGHTLSFDRHVLRALYKTMWGAFAGLGDRAELALTLDESRALYAFYLSHPHAPEGVRAEANAARAGAHDARVCEAIDADERRAAEAWRLERINRLAAIDPDYPAAFARGVVHFRRAKYGAAAEAFRDWLRDHPTGPWTSRAENYLRASAAADIAL
jgi:hypothetical protein